MNLDLSLWAIVVGISFEYYLTVINLDSMARLDSDYIVYFMGLLFDFVTLLVFYST